LEPPAAQWLGNIGHAAALQQPHPEKPIGTKAHRIIYQIRNAFGVSENHSARIQYRVFHKQCAPDLVDPVSGETVAQLLQALISAGGE